MKFVVSHPVSGQRLSSLTLDDPLLSASEALRLTDALGIVAAAHAEAETIRASAAAAYEEEKQRGYEDGLAEARLEQSEQMIEAVSRSVDFFGRIEERMVDLVMQSVQCILDEFDERERIVHVVKKALSAARNQKQMTLRVHPSRLEAVKEAMHDILASYPGIGYLDVLPDSRLDPEGCVLESDIGVVEASVESQLESLRQAFGNVLGARV